MRFPGCAFILADGVARSRRHRWQDAIADQFLHFWWNKNFSTVHIHHLTWADFVVFSLFVWSFVALFVNLFVVHASLCMLVIKRSLCAVLTAHRSFNHICEDYALAINANAFHLHRANTKLPEHTHTHEHTSTKSHAHTHPTNTWHLLRNATKPQTTTIKYESKIMRRISKRLSGHLECIRSVSISAASHLQRKKHYVCTRAKRYDR